MVIDFEYDVFLSHSSKDKVVVRELAERLKADGLRVWLDEWVIQPGDSIPLAIEQGLESSRTLVLVMSEYSVGKQSASDWVTLERHTALFRDPTNQQRRFIPLRLDDCDIKDSLKQFAYVDWRERNSQEYERLLKVMWSTRSVARGRTLESASIKRYKHAIGSVAITPNGEYCVTGAWDRSVKVWHLPSDTAIANLVGHRDSVLGVAITSNGKLVVSASDDQTVRIWRVDAEKCLNVLDGHKASVTCVAVTPDGRRIVSGSADKTLRIWDCESGQCIGLLEGHTDQVNGVEFIKGSDGVVSVSSDGTLRVWDAVYKKSVAVLRGHSSSVNSVATSLDNQFAVTGSDDLTIRVWNLLHFNCGSVLEGHEGKVLGVTVTAHATRIMSSSADRTVRIWDRKSGECVIVLREHFDHAFDVASSHDGRRVVSSSSDATIRIWDVPPELLVSREESSPLLEPAEQTAQYTNAKVLLVGDSGVGKSGLAIRLTEDKFEATISTDAHWATQLKLPHYTSTDRLDREIWLWDFAGQADYRLIHQLFMDETALAVLVFNPQSESPFESLSQWDRDLSRAARRQFAKLLVAGRCDRGGLMVSREVVIKFARKRGFASYLETSALTGDGCERLRDEIVSRIDWDSIPWTASPRIFKLLKDEILKLRDEGVVLLRLGELKQQLEMRLVEEAFTVEELRAVIGLLAGPGLVWKLEFGDVVLLQPEWINKYAAAVIRSIRAHVGEIGVIDEAQVLAGDLTYTMDIVRREADDVEEAVRVEMLRLEPSEEAIVLRAMHQMFVDHGLCVREELESGGRQLIFPSYFKQELPTDPGHPPVLVTYQFNGNAREIYATLVVQLWRTKAFENGDLWRYVADFKSATGARLGLKMVRYEDKNPEISVYFDSEVQDDTKVTFIKYVHEHLLQKAQDVVRLRAFVCPHCGHPVRDTELALEILNEEGANADIRCQQRKCDKRFSLWDVIEQKFASEEFQQRVRELEEKAKAAIDNESRELILEGHARVITGEAGQIYRGYSGSDHGIDGEIEFKDNSGQASGKRLYLQLKSGDSYLYQRKSDGAEVFQIKKPRWETYWREQAYPVMLVIRTSDGQIRWMNVTEYLEENSKRRKTPMKQIVFDGQPFTALNLQRLRDCLIPVKEETAGAG